MADLTGSSSMDFRSPRSFSMQHKCTKYRWVADSRHTSATLVSYCHEFPQIELNKEIFISSSRAINWNCFLIRYKMSAARTRRRSDQLLL